MNKFLDVNRCTRSCSFVFDGQPQLFKLAVRPVHDTAVRGHIASTHGCDKFVQEQVAVLGLVEPPQDAPPLLGHIVGVRGEFELAP